jgi:hypothetical protein
MSIAMIGGGVVKIGGGLYSIGTGGGGGQVATPTFSPAAGTYSAAQTVTISCATAGYIIFYTVDGTTPTTTSLVYSVPITVGATQTVNAIAIATGYTQSATGSAAYTITPSGALSFVNSTTIPTAGGVNGTSFYQLQLQGGSGTGYVYTFNSKTGSNAQFYCTPQQGMIQDSPTVAETATITITGTDSASNSTGAVVFTRTVTSALTIFPVLIGATLQALPNAMVGNKYGGTITGTANVAGHQMRACGGSGTYTGGWSILSGTSPPGLSMSSNGQWTGTPTTAGTYTFVIQVQDSALATASFTFVMVVLPNNNATRPAYNSSVGNGWYILNGKLYDSTNAEFRMRGCNQENNGGGGTISNGIIKSQANMVRWQIWHTSTDAAVASGIQSNGINNGLAVIPVRFNNRSTFGGAATGTATAGAGQNTSVAAGMQVYWSIINDWVISFAPTWSALQTKLAGINICNEWGPIGTAWRDAHMAQIANISAISGTTITISTVSGTNPFANAIANGTAGAYIKSAGGITDQLILISGAGGSSGAWTVQSSVSLPGYTSGGTLNGGGVGVLRAVGYTLPIAMDSGNFGQSTADLTSYAQSVFNSDPLLNCIFSYHAYGNASNTTPALMKSFMANLNSLAQSSGACFAVLEFGPGNNVGSTTTMAADFMIATAEANQLSWAYWAADDNPGNTQFGWSLVTIGLYAVPADLQWAGLQVILNPSQSHASLAAPAPFFLQ